MRRRRILVVFVCAMLGFALILAQLVRLQVLESAMWVRESHRSGSRFRSLPFERGWILDRHGEPLALTEDVDGLSFEYRAWRRGSVAGQVSGACWVLGEAWRGPSEMRAQLGAALPLLGRLTVGEVAALQPRDRRRDLGFYVQRLFGAAVWDQLQEGLRTEPLPAGRSLDSLAGWSAGLAGARQRAASEADAWIRLAGQAGLDLDRRTDEAARHVVGRVARALELDEPWCVPGELDREGYRRLQELQAEFESEAALLDPELPYDATTMVALRGPDLAGFTLRAETRRVYPAEVADLAPLLVGRVGNPQQRDIAPSLEHRERLAWLASLDDLRPEELAEYERLRVLVREIDYAHSEERGMLGLESAFESELRGKRGWESVWLDADGEARREQVQPVPGLDITLTLDVELQRACQTALDQFWDHPPPGHPGSPEHWAGAIVLLDPRSGDVLALASSPRPSRDDLSRHYAALTVDPSRPLNQRAVFAGASGNPPPPGSTFKPVSALAGLAAGVVDAHTRFVCEGSISVGGRRMGCLGVHGEISMERALAVSCNVYFYRLGAALGAERLVVMARRFGFGSATHLLAGNARLEASGLHPAWGLSEASPRLADGPYTRTNAISLAIGQAPLDDVTPLQVAAMMAAVGTGQLRAPRLIADVEGWPLADDPPRPLPVSNENLDVVRAGLARVVDDALHGTGRSLTRLHPELAPRIAAKTGTAQVGGGSDQAWFAGYLPRQQPKLAFAVYIEDCGMHGSEAALPVFMALLDQPAMQQLLEQDLLGAVTPEPTR